ncbi:histone deacetylase family protein [Pseudogemmobacter humi]|uniref:Histone deacetylase-like amidohydrolase n=1 Tax=Pseudogemmobacter humi TaxID=2483812 RepID=A0A3P5WNL7_9RHOB|nr:histone deacetylase family protein [Pseudogemmobacter humi]VDC23338.1 Histone deacetylase-like amidohydrolase [Pseudogemmobacter humi]
MLVYSHKDCRKHLTPEGHPERSARLEAVARGLEGLAVERRDCPLADEAEVLRCHPASYLAKVKAAVPREGLAALDGDTWLSPGSHRAALRAVGGMAAAVDAVLAGEDSAAFVAARPPGHHAERERAMGFCLYGTAAIGVKRALDHHGLSRVAVVDFDVHHGNGTQDLLWDEARCLFAGSHQMPLFPGSGSAAERGAHGQILNLPLAAGTDGAHMRRQYERAILPALADYKPELLIVSAGFDAHGDDPLAALDWEAGDFAWLAARLWDVSGGKLVSTLEGGYDLPALAASVAAYVGTMTDLSR